MWRIQGLLARALNRFHAANVQGCVHGEADALNPSSLIPLGQNAGSKSYSSQSSGPESGQNGQQQKKRGTFQFCTGQVPQYTMLDAVGLGAAAVFFLHLARQVSFHCPTGTSQEDRCPRSTYLRQIFSSLSQCNNLFVRSHVVPKGVQPCTWNDILLQGEAALQDTDVSLENSSSAPSSGSDSLHLAEKGELQIGDTSDIGSSYESDNSAENASSPTQSLLEPKEEIGETLQDAASRLVDVTETSLPTVLNIFGIISTRDSADHRTAFRFFRESAESGYSKAQYNTAVCYEKGRGVTKDMTKAAEYYFLAAKGGHQQAKYRYARHLLMSKPEDTQSAVQMLQEAAQAGLKEAQAYLGVYYSKESHFDPQKAVRYFWMAAENGDVQSRYNLGVCYERGFGVPASRQEAVKHYERAAKSGHGQAQQKVLAMQTHQAEGLGSSSPLASLRAAASSPCLPVLERINIWTKPNTTNSLGLPHSLSTGDLLIMSPADSGSYFLAPVHVTGMAPPMASLRAIGVG
ncbi:death ligand signal enhancer [Mixophyes fleayi]|uniref:death ligand signal enhancer n=1 Tax=Mixophyes fleayi TaxID=3061075 RepID=UPI003F4E1193